MAISTSWIHGNALTVENPTYVLDGNELGRLVLTHYGWGTQVSTEGHPVPFCWFHLPIPTIFPPLSKTEALRLNRVFLLFRCVEASIKEIDIYDNNTKIQEFNDLGLQGDYLTIGTQNTFNVSAGTEVNLPYHVKGGIGLSFQLVSSIGIDPPAGTQPEIMVAGAGAEFETYSAFASTKRGGSTAKPRPPG
jgi:hypothetical protein